MNKNYLYKKQIETLKARNNYKKDIVETEKVFQEINFSRFQDLIKSLNINDIDTLKKLETTYKYNKRVYKILLTSSILEKLNLKRLFFKNDLTIENNIKYSFSSVEDFFYLNSLFIPYNTFKKNFLLDSIIVLKEILFYDNKINVIFCNKVTYNFILKLLDMNKLYGVDKRDKNLYNVFIHIDNNNKHFLLDIEDINFKSLYNKDNLNYTTLEKVENFYINLNDLKFSEKLLLLEKIKDYQKKEYLEYINNLTFFNLKSYYNDYENFNYRQKYKGLDLKDIKINTSNKKEYLSYYYEYIRHLKRLYLKK